MMTLHGKAAGFVSTPRYLMRHFTTQDDSRIKRLYNGKRHIPLCLYKFPSTYILTLPKKCQKDGKHSKTSMCPSTHGTALYNDTISLIFKVQPTQKQYPQANGILS